MFALLALCATPSFAQSAAPPPTAQATPTPTPASKQVDDYKPSGPIPVRDSRPLQLLFLRFAPEDAAVLPRGEKRLGAQLDIANNLLNPAVGAHGAAVTEDNETQRLAVTWRQGIAEKTEASIELSLLARNGGILDGPISAYHRLLGIRGNGPDDPVGRDAVPRGRSILFYQDAAGNTVNAGSAFGLGETSLFLKRSLVAGPKTAVALRLGAKLPTGNSAQYLGSGGFDAGLMLDASYRLGPHYVLYANAGAVKMGRDNNLPDERGGMLQGSLAIEWVRKRSSIIAQVDANSRVVTTGNAFADRTPVTATVGYKRRLRHGREFFASFSENGDYTNYHVPGLGNIGPDFTISMGIEWRR